MGVGLPQGGASRPTGRCALPWADMGLPFQGEDHEGSALLSPQENQCVLQRHFARVNPMFSTPNPRPLFFILPALF